MKSIGRMSLYDDIAPSKVTDSGNLKMLAESMRLRQQRNHKKSSNFLPPPSISKNKNLQSKNSAGSSSTSVFDSSESIGPSCLVTRGTGSLFGGDWDPTLEYDPS